MAIVKRDQILQEADKLAGRGKVDAAIKEYRRALDLIPNDTNTLNRLGDLLVRVDRIPEAIDVYQKIAEHFGRDGFFLKAIAIYKKVNRLDPQRTDIYEQLADLYFKQGLAVEGRQQLLTLADWFLRSKNLPEAIRVHQRLVELEPTNFQARGKLVDLFVQLDDKANVAAEISTLGGMLLGRGMLEEAAKLYHRALDLVPEQAELVAPAVEALVAGGRAGQAAELGDRALAESSAPSVELAQAVARAKMEAGELGEARAVLERVLQEAGERTAVIQLYGDLMLRSGDISVAKEHMLPVVTRLAESGDRARASALVKKLLRSAPGDLEVLERATQVFSRSDDPDMAVTLEAALADALLRAGRREEAGVLYRRLAEEEPENRLFAQRLRELGLAKAAPAVPAAEPEARDDEAGAGFFPNLGAAEEAEAEVEFVEVEIPSEDGEAAPGPVDVTAANTEELPPVHEFRPPPEPEPAGNIEELYTEAMVFVKYGLVDKAVSHLQRLLEIEPGNTSAHALMASLGMPVATTEPVPASLPAVNAPPAAVAAAPAATADTEFEILQPGVRAASGRETEVPDEAAALPVMEAPAVPAPPLLAAPEHETASEQADGFAVDFSPVEEPSAPAAPAPEARRPKSAVAASGGFRLEELESMLGLAGTGPARPGRRPAPPVTAPAEEALQFDEVAEAPLPGGVPEGISWSVAGGGEPQEQPVAVAAAPQVDEIPGGVPGEPAPPGDGAPEFAEPVEELVDVADVLAGPDVEQLRELDLFLRQGLLDDAADLLRSLQADFPDSPDVTSRLAMLKAKGWEEPAPAPSGEVTAEELFSEEEQFFDLAAELERELAEDELVAEATGSAGSSEESIEDLFREFQRGVAEQIGEEDFDTHFNLGLAYREMELLDEAIGEFQLAAASPPLFVESASMIASCYVDRGLPDAAIEWFQRALSAPKLAPETEVGLRYELARAQELSGNSTAALGNYAEVLAVNPGFRDVVDRVARLQSN